MSQNITLLGASYSAVPAVTLPKTGGGTASFTDVSDTTAAAADVASGKYFYTAAGVRTQGTSSGGTIEDGDELEYGTAGLAGTTWYFNASPAKPSWLADSAQFDLSFESNGVQSTGLSFMGIGGDYGMSYMPTIGAAYITYFGGWQNQAYRTISITGGADATNADLIAWIEANATQQ